MPSLRDIRNRITSVRSTRQITRAMKMVSAAKLRRAQDAILRTRPYVQLLDQMLARVAARAGGEDEAPHPLLAARPKVRAAEVVVITSDRGLAGGFNSNIVRRTQRFLIESDGKYEEVRLATVGRKGRDGLKARRLEVRKDFSGVQGNVRYETAAEIAQEYSERFLSGELDAVFLCYNEFKSAISQRPVVVQLLPIAPPAGAEGAAPGVDFAYEPARAALLGELLPRHVAMQVWRALLESAASEHGARMSAMESATKNAEEMIGALTLQYNRARQAYVTKELLEIVSGAEALK